MTRIADRYEVEVELGRGGMGRVVRAVDTRTLRRVAIKLMDPKLSSDVIAVQRFEREMHATTLLEHPNTIRVYDFGRTTDDELYLVMELIDGVALSSELEHNGALTLERVVRVALQVARALVAAHANRIVHRDLKPSNVMLRDLYGERDVVTVLDFGIADLQGASRLTSTGLVAGSPPYCSPEAASGAPIGPKADLYQLGIILYECLTDTLPFESDSAMGYLYAHVHKLPERPSLQRPGIPPWLDELVMQLLEKDPERRPESAAAVVQTLSQADVSATTPDAKPAVKIAPTVAAPIVRAMTPTGLAQASSLAAMGTTTPTLVRRRRPWLLALMAVAMLTVIAVLVVTLATQPTAVGGVPPKEAVDATVAIASGPDVEPLDVLTPAEAEIDQADIDDAKAEVDEDTPTDAADIADADSASAPTAPKKLAQVVRSVPPGADIYRGATLLGRAEYTERRFNEGDYVRLKCRLANREDGTWEGKWGSRPVVCNVGPVF